MPRQWLRKCSLIVSNESGQGLELSELRIKFAIKKTGVQTPNTAEIFIYNLALPTALKIQKEFTRVLLQAGHVGNMGAIFTGNVKQIMRGRESATDPYLQIVAADGDEAYNFSVVNTTLAAGSTQAAQVAAAILPMVGLGALPGFIADLGFNMLPRGKVMYGMARDYLRQSALSSGTAWSIQDGKVQLVKLSGIKPGAAILLTPATGLIDTPEQTNEGIKIKCLINPSIKVGGVVDIKDAEINLQKVKEKQTGTDGKQKDAEPVKVADDGIYKVLQIEYSGDTRGTDWYQTLVCVGIDDTAPANKKVKVAETPWTADSE